MTFPPSDALKTRLQQQYERTLTPDEVRAYLDAPVSDAEREDVLSLVRWFRGRYPEPADRLAYVRRAYARWQQTRRAI